MKPAIYVFAALSAIGLALSLVSHIAALLGSRGPLGGQAWLLHVGIFIVWFPAILLAQRLTKGAPRKDFWKVALRGCPPWTRHVVSGLFGYVFLNFLVFLFTHPTGKRNGESSMSASEIRGFSGHWMLFYAAAWALFSSALRLWDIDGDRRCPNGHTVSPSATFCDTCGAPAE